MYKRIRSVVIISTTIALYIWLCYLLGQADLFVTHTLRWAVLQVGICILLLPLLSIELQTFPTRYIIRCILGLLCINLLVQGWSVRFGELERSVEVQRIFRLGALFVFHLGLAIFVWYKERIMATRLRFTPTILFFNGVNIFSLFVAASFALLIAGSYDKIHLSCNNILPKAEDFLNSFAPASLLPVNESGAVEELSDNAVLSGSGSESILATFSSEVSQYRMLLIDDILGPKEKLDQEFCQLVVEQIAMSSQLPGFRLSAVVLLFVLLSPVAALVLNVLMGVGAAMFYLLLALGVYRWEERQLVGKGLT